MAVEVGERAGLPKVFDAERAGAVAGDAAVQGLVSRLLSRPRQPAKAAKQPQAATDPEAAATEPATPPVTPPETGPNGAAAPA